MKNKNDIKRAITLYCDLIESGKNCIFNTHGTDSEWQKRDGEKCQIVRCLTEKEVDIFDVGIMYRIRFSDGVEADAFEDELEEIS